MTSPAALSPTPFGRVVTAMVTPFDASGAVDLPLAGRLARHLVEQGSDGLVVSGTTGESPTLSWQEQLQLLQAVREAVGSDAQVLAGTGSNCTAEAVEATRQAAAAGADGALVVVGLPIQDVPSNSARAPAAPTKDRSHKERSQRDPALL